MKPIITIMSVLSLLSYSCESSQQSEKVSEKSVLSFLNEIDSVDVWTSQWSTTFDLNTKKFKQAISIYGKVIFLYEDSIYDLSSSHGHSGTKPVHSNSTLPYFIDNSIKKELRIVNDSMYVHYNDYTKVTVTDTCKYSLVDSYFRRKVLASDVLNSLQKGAINPPDWQVEKYLGIPINEWVQYLSMSDGDKNI
jgi:hypothetical protein